ncbi:MAG: hypothetical protein NDI93_15085 [Pseudomonas sp.]|nr:hypothetical protein [Pseudomonas sp.]
MDNNLSRLISDYQASIRTALALMQRSGIQMPLTSHNWINSDLPQRGDLEGNTPYFKHGAGCAVGLPTGEVDFDFGELGEIGGVDEWRLTNFAGGRLAEYGFETKEALQDCFKAAVSEGSLVHSGYTLYYVANEPRALAVEVDSRSPGDALPLRSEDPVLTLYAHSFLAADLMRNEYEKLNIKWRKLDNLSRNDDIKLGVYLSSWLGYLRATCEGFENINMHLLLKEDRPVDFRELISKSDEIGKMMKKHRAPLRKFRNDVFHPRKNIEATRNFFTYEAERLPWAHKLHAAFAEFFSEYRIFCEVHYVIHGRRNEMDTGRKRPKQRKMNVS